MANGRKGNIEMKPTWNGIELYAEIPKGREILAFRIPRMGEEIMAYADTQVVKVCAYNIHNCADAAFIILKPLPKKRYAVAKVELPDHNAVWPTNDSLRLFGGQKVDFQWQIIEEEEQ